MNREPAIRGGVRTQVVFPPAMLHRAQVTARCVGFRGLSELLRFLLANWLRHIEKDPKAQANIAKYEKDIREELSATYCLDFNARAFMQADLITEGEMPPDYTPPEE